MEDFMKNMQKYEQLAITELDAYLFGQGTHYEIYNKMGAHVGVKDGKEGVYFAVWAPAAREVYVIGEFNNWNAYGYDMKKISDGGIYDLFIPGAKAGDMYKFLIISQSGEALYKADPYANQAQLRPETASIVADLSGYEWKDSEWVEKKKTENHLKAPLSIYECHLGSWKKKDDGTEDGFYTYRELAPELAKYVSDMGYTHIELMGIAEYPYDGSWGYQVTGYYAPTARYGTPKDFMYFVDYMHEKGIGVILDWVPAHFPKDAHGLANFDGSCVYEYADPRKGEHPDWGTKVFDYSKNEVANFLIANGMFWVDKFHIDGLRVDAVASMLYLDYGRTEGNWVPNKYGDNGNLEAISFLKHFNSMLKKRFPQAITIAEESTAWPMVSGDPDNGECLGFTFKWNMGWMHDFLEYMKLDPYFRKFNHSKMTFSLMYAYSENFILVLSHDEVVHLKCSMLGKMPGDREDKFKNLKLAYAYMCGHPGKKLLFMGQEFGQWNEWSEKRALDWYLLEDESHTELKDFTKKCLKLNKNYPCLYATDYSSEGFRWINANDKDNSVLSFMRISPDGKKNLLFVLNFTPVERDRFRIGVPFKTKYKLVLGDNEADQKKTLTAVKGDCDGYPQSLLIDLHKYGIAVYEFNGDVSKVQATKI
ncbi:1,4-alpha-glucan branching protein GlgB [Lachnospira eligens]|jgi:1,4-alpha-glucan branching enzyme|uniref:1,4-alpha-glucan branching enzyme GlgB n=2 Tax=Lachnospira eligens TaxID=39485 RepID=A0A415M9A6_9FIRM|nr:1,4-alpha-glucan branching protein GlgB [Lachnospira eligens]RHA46612.1 1,4-alpha-glucan branching protein GlgB [Lachnospira eligens]RHC12200.1 1,4-alpha-glucan branching protein GlgB [Lachnospira eligens]RHD07684.1 1,4-alpha-glucan branching protein GlgB [Lachnospira eligens]RHK43605.1 1,4-alpha-glucan branching protein GlgB [Lachnospira eligens]